MPNQYTIAVYDNIGFFNSTGSSICIIYTYYNGGAPGGSEIFPKFNKRGESEKNRKINKRAPPFIRHLRVLIQYIYVISKLNYYIYYIYTNIHNEHLVITRST